MSEDTDARLVRDCRRGDRKAFETLLRNYERPIFNAALRILDNRDDAKDVTQTVFLKAYENLDRYNPKYRFYSWIYRIALNESINVINTRKRTKPIDEDGAPDWRSPEEAAGEAELSNRLQDALMSISADYRTVIVMKHFLDCSYREISEILDIPEKTVKSRLFTARQRMRDALKASGLFSS